MRLAIDAMGGDHGSRPIIQGVCRYLACDPEVTVILVGDRDRLNRTMVDLGLGLSNRLQIVHASQVMEMDDKVSGLREKRDSSIFRLVQEVREGRAEAMIALGNTAAAVGAATIGLKLLSGVRRAGIAVPMPTRDMNRPCVVIDMGANTASKPKHLMAYAIMASIYSEKILGVANPRVGLLNVGQERGKGNQDLRDAFELLDNANLNFLGNVEGCDIFSGECDVVVCDGFIGNAVLKASEELANTVTDWMKEAFLSSWISKLGALLARGGLKQLKKRVDYAAYGGAPLLGVNGICIIGHGRSSPNAVFNALRVAKESTNAGLLNLIEEAIPSTRLNGDK